MKVLHVLLVVFSLLYPILRYNIFGEIPARNYPSYVFNKTFCIYSSFTLLLYAILYVRGRFAEATPWMRRTLFTVGIHILLSVSLLSAGYYQKMFFHERLHFFGEIALLSGVLASVLYWKEYCNSVCLQQITFPLYAGTLLVCIHLTAIGWKGWLTPEKWQGHMPPITLLCCLVVFAATLLLFKGKKLASQ